MTIAISSDRYFEYDQIGIRGVSRFDINIHSRGTSRRAGLHPEPDHAGQLTVSERTAGVPSRRPSARTAFFPLTTDH